MTGPLISSEAQLHEIMSALRGYLRLPFAGDNVPGAFVEAVIAKVRGGEVLRTYDFADVVNQEQKLAWQVKSTLAATTVTWKRAKIPDAPALIAASQNDGEEAVGALGDAILKFCNDHAVHSLELYGLDAIGYARLYVARDRLVYFERELVSKEAPLMFDPEAFEWRWSEHQRASKKEMLPAFHGFHRDTGNLWFKWHGLGENQLHFPGDKFWWPEADAVAKVEASIPDADRKITYEEFVDWVSEKEDDLEAEGAELTQVVVG